MKFYATIKGNRQARTCGGSANSGIQGSVQSWNGSICSSMWYDDEDKLMVRVGTSDDSSSSIGWSSPEFRGTFSEFKDLLKLAEDIKSGRVSVVHHRNIK